LRPGFPLLVSSGIPPAAKAAARSSLSIPMFRVAHEIRAVCPISSIRTTSPFHHIPRYDINGFAKPLSLPASISGNNPSVFLMSSNRYLCLCICTTNLQNYIRPRLIINPITRLCFPYMAQGGLPPENPRSCVYFRFFQFVPPFRFSPVVFMLPARSDENGCEHNTP
jgi:hypothetical protein